ncbi:MAG: Extracellular solute-binding protein [Chloroflexi bacterium]|nr:Extracellular solute-binding protein [Chloroflexota bacterium]
MRRTIGWLSVAVVLSACAAPSGQSPAAPAIQPPSQVQPQTPQLTEWDRVLAAAKQEGKVTVIGLEGDATRESLTVPFEQKYGITVEYLSESGPGVPPRISNERAANQYLWDIYVLGTTTALAALIPSGALDPIDSAMILPEVTEGRNWRGGGIEYLDPQKRLIVMTPFQRGTIFINPTLVRPDEIKSYRDLLDPKWKGRMIMNDPRRAGPGLATFTFFYFHPDLGPEFIRALATQDITIMSNFIQEADFIGQGRNPILIGTADAIVEQRMSQGIPIAIVDPRQLKEGSDVSPANGALGLFNRAPHPNAAKVYINWLLGKDGQTGFAKASGYVSSRVDVPTDHAAPWRVPLPNSIKTYTIEAVQAREKVVELLQEVFGPS